MKENFKYFDEFHKNFKGDVKSINTGHICIHCAHNCEVVADDEEIDFKYILAFLPDEMEYAAGKMNIPLSEFKDKYCYEVQTGKSAIQFLKFSRQCPFLNKDFECEMGETKIIACKIYPLIHYPLIEFTLSTHCDLSKDKAVMELFYNGLEKYKLLLDQIGLTDDYRYYRECFDILQLDAKKAFNLLDSRRYDILDITEFKKFLLACPDCI